MVLRRILHTLILAACLSPATWGHEPEGGGVPAARRDLARTPPVAVRIDDSGQAGHDPAPVPTRMLQPQAEAMTIRSAPGAEAMLVDSRDDAHGFWNPICRQCGDATCQDCVTPCPVGGQARHVYPPARWDVLRRIGYHWNTKTKPCLQASHWGYPEEFCERPFGSSIRQNLCTQIANGLQDQLTLYRYDFVDETLAEAYQLKPRGRYELAKIVALLQHRALMQSGFGAICIEETVGQPELNEARRQHVLQQLELMQFPVPSEHVVVGRPNQPGISGDESLQIYTNLMRQWQSGGARSDSGMGQGQSMPSTGTGLGLGGSGGGSQGW